MGASRIVHIESKARLPDADAGVLERALAGHAGKDLVPADAAALSGLPLDAAEPALLVLARRYPARIRVTESGQLLFRFDTLSRPRGPSLATRVAASLRAALERSVAAATIALGPALLAVLVRDVVALGSAAMQAGWFWLAMLPCMVVGTFAALAAVLTFTYFVAFPLAGVGLLVGGATLVIVGAAERGSAAMAILGLVMLAGGVPLTLGGVRLWRDAVFRKPTWARNLWRGAVLLLFGPPLPSRDGLADERELVALIRHKKGVLVTADLVDLFGWTPAEADAEIARVLCDYGGDVAVTERGELVYAFTDPRAVSGPGTMTGSLLATAGVDVPPPARVRPAPRRFFGGDRGSSVAVLVALGVGALGVLVHPALPLFPGPSELVVPFPELQTERGPVALPGLGLWPYVFVYGALLLRVPAWLAESAREARRRQLEPYLAIAGRTPAGAPLPPEAGPVDTAILAALGGDLDADGRVCFPELARDLAGAERLRAARRDATQPLGRVVF